MKELKFIQAVPDDTYYTWQVHLWLESLRKLGHSDKAINLIFTPKGRTLNEKWKQIVELYPESEFVFYSDEDNISMYIPVYIPILRPYVLWRYFKDNPEMENNAILYCDSDILFTDKFDVTKLLEDDICYLSNTNSYINASYFDSKIRDVLPEKLELYKTRDILSEITTLTGISREIAEKNNLHSGGAQYLLKGINSDFWKKVMTDTIQIRIYLQNVNKEFFKNESMGFQSWCADMWAVLWNLWFTEKETKVVEELNFAWSSDNISRLENCPILHNAGITGVFMSQDVPYFFKGKYHLGQNPLLDPHLDVVLSDERSKLTCNWVYAKELKELYEKYKINY